ncbi:MAG: hypothetical protein AB7E59_09525 [Pusillimonas sp.]
MNIPTLYIKGCAAVVAFFVYLIGTTRSLPDWLAFTVLLAPVIACAVVYPGAVLAVCLLLSIALLSMIAAMHSAQSS